MFCHLQSSDDSESEIGNANFRFLETKGELAFDEGSTEVCSCGSTKAAVEEGSTNAAVEEGSTKADVEEGSTKAAVEEGSTNDTSLAETSSGVEECSDDESEKILEQLNVLWKEQYMQLNLWDRHLCICNVKKFEFVALVINKCTKYRHEFHILLKNKIRQLCNRHYGLISACLFPYNYCKSSAPSRENLQKKEDIGQLCEP